MPGTATVLQALQKMGFGPHQNKTENLSNISAITKELVILLQTWIILFSNCLHALKQHITIICYSLSFLAISFKNNCNDTSLAVGHLP